MSNTGVQWAARAARAALMATAAVAFTAISGAAAASAGPASYSTEAFRETIRPWDSITIPALSCHTGYLENQDYSPGRIVPKGVEILEPDAIGVTISEVKSTLVTDWRNTPHYPVTGTTPHGGHSTATNWDPLASK